MMDCVNSICTCECHASGDESCPCPALDAHTCYSKRSEYWWSDEEKRDEEERDMEATSPEKQRGNRERGFAAMSPEKQREIASKGGKAAHKKGVAHEFTPDEARIAGRKGGETVSRDREHMSAIGKAGSRARKHGTI